MFLNKSPRSNQFPPGSAAALVLMGDCDFSKRNPRVTAKREDKVSI